MSDNDLRSVVVNDPQQTSMRVNDMRKQISLRLSEEALEELDALTRLTGLSPARLVERMLLGLSRVDGQTKIEAPTVEDLMTSESLVPTATVKRQINAAATVIAGPNVHRQPIPKPAWKA